MPSNPQLLTPEEVATYLRVSPRTLADWAAKGRGPRFTKAGRQRRYDPRDIEDYLIARYGPDDPARGREKASAG